MKVTERTIAEIAHLSLNPTMERLSERAKQEIAEKFCKPRCGHGPEGNFCPEAYATYRKFLVFLLEGYVSLN